LALIVCWVVVGGDGLIDKLVGASWAAPRPLKQPTWTPTKPPPGTLVAHWQAAAMLSTAPPFRCRELIQGGVNSALPRALREVGALARQHGGGHPGVVCVTGSLHAVAAASRELEAMWR